MTVKKKPLLRRKEREKARRRRSGSLRLSGLLRKQSSRSGLGLLRQWRRLLQRMMLARSFLERCKRMWPTRTMLGLRQWAHIRRSSLLALAFGSWRCGLHFFALGDGTIGCAAEVWANAVDPVDERCLKSLLILVANLRWDSSQSIPGFACKRGRNRSVLAAAAVEAGWQLANGATQTVFELLVQVYHQLSEGLNESPDLRAYGSIMRLTAFDLSVDISWEVLPIGPAGQNPTIQYLDINGSWTSAALSSVSVKKPVSSGHLRTSARLPEWPAISREIFQAYGLELAQKLVSRLSSGVAKSITAADFPDLCAEPGGADQLTHQGSRRFCGPLRAFHTCVCQ